jgi:trk system potassium uptake protein TrkH
MMQLFRSFRIIRTERAAPSWLMTLRSVVTALVAVALVLIVLRHGYLIGFLVSLDWLLQVLTYVIIAGTLADIVLSFLFAPTMREYVRVRWFDLVLVVPLVAGLVVGMPVLAVVVIRQVIVLTNTFTNSRRFAGIAEQVRLQPVRLMAMSFVGLIAVGTLFLTFPSATADGRGTPFLDALFTATSATCVTGLIVRDTPVYFSLFGQLVILALIQLGGLGIMTFSASLAVIFGRRLGMGQRQAMSSMIEEARDIDIARTLRYILLLTLLAEAVGTLLLFIRWLGHFPTLGQTFYQAAFHAVSAFCNAGFSLFSDSLVRYCSDLPVNLVVIGLILLGGLGFSVVHELVSRRTLRQTPPSLLRRLTVHSRLVLSTSALLVVAGTVVFFFFEYDNVLAHLPLGTKLLAALFQSVTPRTAGFNTVPLVGLKPVTILLWSLLMFIGASPGGTGGGIKTTTLAVLFLAVRNRIAGREDVEFRGRLVPRDVVYRATSIAAVSAAIAIGFYALLLITERAPFSDILFETVSAFGTVGLSTGVTPHLTAAGKVAIVVLMYVGRLGPLTLALAMRAREPRLPITYPEARILVG